MASSKALVPAQQRMQSLRTILESKKSAIAAILPRHLTAERVLKVAMVAASRNPVLLECDQLSILRSVMIAAQLGLEPDGPLGHAYLVPYRNAKAGRMEAQFQLGYRGLIDLARRSGQIASIEAHVVHENDRFICTFGLAGKLEHEPLWSGDPGPFKAAYAIAHLVGGGVQYEVMTRAQIDGIRAGSRSGSGGPWVSHYDEMARKTVVKRLCKYLPLSVELARAVAADSAEESGDAGAIDAEFDLPTDDAEPQTATEKLLEKLPE